MLENREKVSVPRQQRGRRSKLHREQTRRRVVRQQHSGVVPKITMAEGLPAQLHEYVTRLLRCYGGEVEVGGMFTGQYRLEDGVPAFRINGFIEAGPKAELLTDSVLFDSDYQFEMLQAIRLKHPRTGNMGCFHVHPGQMDECSAGDYLADIAAVRESDTRGLVFGIITIGNPRQEPQSIYFDNLKLDLFVLAEQTGFEYVHVQPALEPIPVADAGGERNETSSSNAAAGYKTHYSWCSGLLEDKKRLVAEVRAMEERYGDRAVLRHQRNQLYWEYTVIESGRRFPIEIRYPRRYPLEPPRIISLLPLPSSPHQLVNNELCWINRAAGDWNPARDTAATCIHAAHRWFACLLVYVTLGKWPEEANDEPLRTI